MHLQQISNVVTFFKGIVQSQCQTYSFVWKRIMGQMLIIYFIAYQKFSMQVLQCRSEAISLCCLIQLDKVFAGCGSIKYLYYYVNLLQLIILVVYRFLAINKLVFIHVVLLVKSTSLIVEMSYVHMVECICSAQSYLEDKIILNLYFCCL